MSRNLLQRGWRKVFAPGLEKQVPHSEPAAKKPQPAAADMPAADEARQKMRTALEAGLRHHQSGRFAEAELYYSQALALDARQADALHLLGVIALQTGDRQRAAELINAALAINPAAASYHSNMGNVLRATGQLEDAVTAFETAIRLQPDHAEAQHNLASSLLALRRHEAAVAAYTTAIRLHPHAEAHYNLGNALLALERFDAAIAAYNAAIRLKPDYGEAHSNRGNALMSLGRAGEALACYTAAIRIAPELASAHYNHGTALQALGRFEAAAAAYETAIRLKPAYTKPHSNLVMYLHYQPETDEAAILTAARRYAAHIVPRPRAAFTNNAEPERRLRIGYVSGNFYRHSVADYLAPVLSQHDAARVELFCYNNSPTADDMTERLRAAAHHWREVAGLADDAVTARIMADGIDILVDLSGHTNGNRLALFAGRAAPVQASWLGFWGTTGVAAMDYIISDADTIPPGQDAHYSERVMRLPGSRFCYQPPDYAPEPVAPPCLAGGGVTFGSFNNLAKLGPEVIQLWAQLLLAVPGSRLLLKWKTLASAPVRQELAAAFATAGIGPERLILRGGAPHETMLAEYGAVDIALDPFPFSGGVTSCEALWMGVPVVTLPGPKPASRQTLGFLRSIGRAEWVAGSPDAYLRLATALAADKVLLAECRAGQRQRMAMSPLCDGAGFTRQLENAYRAMWQAWCAEA